MSGTSTEQDTIIEVLRDSREIAIVGMSGDEDRPSYGVAEYLQKRGYHIIPVNPKLTEVLGERAYPDLLSIPGPVDVVDVFRRPESVPEIVDQAIRIKAKAVWMQEGVGHQPAAQRARDAGLRVVVNRCMKKELRRLTEEKLLPSTLPRTASTQS
jgi:uncharacterized protein